MRALRVGAAVVVATATAIGLLCAPASATDTVKVGLLRLPQTTFIAMDKGFFAAEGIEVQPVIFRSGAELVPSLSTGQIDVAATAVGAALFNAIEQGVHATIVADHWVSARTSPSGDSQFITVRKDLITSGKLKRARDARGLVVAVTARGQLSDLFTQAYLKSGGLTAKDVRFVYLSYPDMLGALEHRAVDIACMIDPYVTLAENQGVAQRVVAQSSLLPGAVQAVTMYGDRLGKTDRTLGMRYMRALTKANIYLRRRLTNAAGRAEIAQIYQKYVPLEDAAIYERIGLGSGPDNLSVDIDGRYGLRWQEMQFVEEGLVANAPDIRKAVDNTFADAAARGKSGG